jgi:hypothetical protein
MHFRMRCMLDRCEAGSAKPARNRGQIGLGSIRMRPAQLATLKFFALLFLLPGLAGLILSATISTSYLEKMPQVPVISEDRVVPREIHGIVVYQTREEDKKLSSIEDWSVAVFVVGLGLGLVFLEKWGATQARYGEENDDFVEDRS